MLKALCAWLCALLFAFRAGIIGSWLTEQLFGWFVTFENFQNNQIAKNIQAILEACREYAANAEFEEKQEAALLNLARSVIANSLRFRQTVVKNTESWAAFLTVTHRLGCIINDNDERIRVDLMFVCPKLPKAVAMFGVLLGASTMAENIKDRFVRKVVHVTHAKIVDECYLSTKRREYTSDMRYKGFLLQGHRKVKLDKAIVKACCKGWISSFCAQVAEAAAANIAQWCEDEGIAEEFHIDSALSRMNDAGLLKVRLYWEIAIMLSGIAIWGMFRMDTRGRGIAPSTFIFNPWAYKKMRACLRIDTLWTEQAHHAVALFLSNELYKKEISADVKTTEAGRLTWGMAKLEEIADKYRNGWHIDSNTPYKEIWAYRIARNYSEVGANYGKRNWHVPVEVDQNASCLCILGVLLHNYELMVRTNTLRLDDRILDPYTFDKVDPKWRGILKWIVMLFAFGHNTGYGKSLDNMDTNTWIQDLFVEMLKSSTVSDGDKELLLGEPFDRKKRYTLTPEVEKVLQSLVAAAKSLPSTKFSRILRTHGNGGSTVTFNIGCGTVQATSSKRAHNANDEPDRYFAKTVHFEWKRGEISWYLKRSQVGYIPLEDGILRYTPTGLVHHLDSRVCEYTIRKVLEAGYFGISIHDAYVVDPNAVTLVKSCVQNRLHWIFCNADKFLTKFCQQTMDASCRAELRKLETCKDTPEIRQAILNSATMH